MTNDTPETSANYLEIEGNGVVLAREQAAKMSAGPEREALLARIAKAEAYMAAPVTVVQAPDVFAEIAAQQNRASGFKTNGEMAAKYGMTITELLEGLKRYHASQADPTVTGHAPVVTVSNPAVADIRAEAAEVFPNTEAVTITRLDGSKQTYTKAQLEALADAYLAPEPKPRPTFLQRLRRALRVVR